MEKQGEKGDVFRQARLYLARAVLANSGLECRDLGVISIIWEAGELRRNPAEKPGDMTAPRDTAPEG